MGLEQLNNDLENSEHDGEISGNEDLGSEGNEGEGDSSNSYVPSYTYKVKDQEKQFDERMKPFIKTKEDEEYVRDLYTRADGLDAYKEKLSKKDQMLNQFQTGFQTLKEYRDQKQYDKLFNALGLTDEEVLNFSHKKAQEYAMPAEERAKIEKDRKLQDELESYKAEAYRLKNETQQQLVQRQMFEMENLVSSNTELNKALMDRGLNLKEEVLKQGQFMTLMNGREPSVKEAYEETVKRFSTLLGFQQDNNTNQKKPTLANLKGNNSAHIQKAVTLADLRRMANEF